MELNDGDPMPTIFEGDDGTQPQSAAAPAPEAAASQAPIAPAPPSAPDPIERLAHSIDASTRTNQQIIQGFLSRETRPSAPALPPDPGAMPVDGDPVSMQRWIEARDARRDAIHRAEREADRAEQSEAQVAQTLWTEILTDPATHDLARHAEVLFAAAWREAGGRVPPGVSPREFKERIVADVRTRAAQIARLGAPASAAPAASPSPSSAPGNAPAPANPVAAAPAAATPNRTAGLSGPSAQSARPRAEVQDPNRGILDDIRDVQGSSPYF